MLTLRQAMVTAVSFAAVVSSSVACGAPAEPVSARGATASSEDGASGAVGPDDVREIAIRAAVAGGDDSPRSIEWVVSTRSRAAEVTSGSVVVADDANDVAVVVIQVQGSFVAKHASTPYAGDGEGAAPVVPAGEFITLVVEQATGKVLDYGLMPRAADLGRLGTVSSA